MLRITTPYFVAGIVVGKRAAPIIKYMTPWTKKDIRQYCKKRRWKVEEIDGEDPASNIKPTFPHFYP